MQIYKYFPKFQNFIPKVDTKREDTELNLCLLHPTFGAHFYLTMQWLKGVLVCRNDLLLDDNIPVEEVGCALLLQRR